MDSSSSPHQQDGTTISKNLICRRARNVIRQKRVKESKICPECKGGRVEGLLRCQSCYNQYSSQDSEHDMKRPRSSCMKPQDSTIPNHTEKSSELDENSQSGKSDGTGTTLHHTLFMDESLVERRIYTDSSDAGSSNEVAIIHWRSFDGMNSNHERKDDAHDDQDTRRMTGDLLGTRDLLASLDMFVNPHASHNIDLNKPLDCGFDEFDLPEPSQVLELSVGSTCKNKENPTLQMCRTENSSPVRAVVDKGKALVDSPPVSMNTSSSYQNNSVQFFPEIGSNNMPPLATDPQNESAFTIPKERSHPGSLQSSQLRGVSAQPDTPWSGVELDSLWLGVRRHGEGNWDVMLGDRNLHFLPGKTSKVWAQRWEEEQVQLLYGVSVSHLRYASPYIASRDMNNHQSTDARYLTGNRTVPLGSTCPSHGFDAHKNNQLQIPVTNSSRLSPNSTRDTRNSAIWSMRSPDGELLWEHFPWFI